MMNTTTQTSPTGAARIVATADTQAMSDVSPELRAAVLANSHIKIILKPDRAAG